MKHFCLFWDFFFYLSQSISYLLICCVLEEQKQWDTKLVSRMLTRTWTQNRESENFSLVCTLSFEAFCLGPSFPPLFSLQRSSTGASGKQPINTMYKFAWFILVQKKHCTCGWRMRWEAWQDAANKQSLEALHTLGAQITDVVCQSSKADVKDKSVKKGKYII